VAGSLARQLVGEGWHSHIRRWVAQAENHPPLHDATDGVLVHAQICLKSCMTGTDPLHQLVVDCCRSMWQGTKGERNGRVLAAARMKPASSSWRQLGKGVQGETLHHGAD
jgi:hypothetical protein